MFIGILILVVLSIAGSAAFFSVYGLGQIFTGAFWPVVLMGGSLEAGKLVAASYAYRYWNHISAWLKTYLVSAVFVLMLITSIGIFGFLSAAYQKDILPLAEMEAQIESIEAKLTNLETLKLEKTTERVRLVDDKSKEIAALPDNYATKKKEVAERYQVQLDKVDVSILGYENQIKALFDEKQKLKITTINQEIKTGPIVFIAEAFGQHVDNATKWLIIIIIFAFDPLAVALTIGANIALVERSTHKRRRVDDRADIVEEALETAEILPEPIKQDETTVSPEELPIDDIRRMIDSLNGRKLSREEGQQKRMLEQILAKKVVKENLQVTKNS
jgi:hypothetical protein